MSVVDVIGHYQRSIEKCSGDPQRLLHCMGKLYGLPISVHHLQTTGVGRTVNSLRKYEGAVGEAAKALVLKWKQMVTDEGSSEEEENPEEDDEEADSAVETGEEDVEEEGETVKIADSEEEEEEVKQRNTEVKNELNEKVVRREEGKNHHHHRHKSSHSERREEQHKSSSEKSDSRRMEGSSKSSHHDSKREDKHWEKKEEKRREERKKREEMKRHEEEVKRHEEEKRREEEVKRHEEEVKRHEEEVRREEERKEEQRRVKEEAKKREERKARKEEERRKQKEEEKKRRKEEEKKLKEKKHKEEKRMEERKVEKSKDKEERVNGEEKSKRESKEVLPSSSKGESEAIPSKLKKKRKVVEMEDGSIDCGSGASFAEALGMVEPMRSKGSPASPSKLKKKKKEHASPLAKSSVSNSSLSTPSKSGGKSSQLTPRPASELLSDKDFDVLSPSAASRLEPLEVDIAATLPQTVPHYRPLPYPRLDYSPPRGNHNNKGGMITEEEALSAIMNTKNQRTKVYSGSRSSFTYVPTLYELCIRLLQENIDALGQTGGVPFDLLKPVLERATPQQLLFLEDENPYLIEDTDALWCFHCQKDFRNRERLEMETWREMYLRCSDEREAKLKALTANIQRSMVQAQMPVRRTKLAYVDTVAKPPRNVARTQAKYGTSRAPIKPLVKAVVATPGGSSTSRLVAASSTAGGTSPVSLSSAAASARIGVIATSTNKKPKPAPLMQKTLKFMKGRFKR